jgi:uncharacterized protein YkwD
VFGFRVSPPIKTGVRGQTKPRSNVGGTIVRTIRQAHRSRLLACAALAAIALTASGCAQARARLAGHVAPPPPAPIHLVSPVTSAEQQIVNRVNQYRAQHGLPALKVNATLVNKARNWSRWMAAGGCGRDARNVAYICHSSLPQGINVSWSLLEENVGSAAPKTMTMAVQTGFENSPPHRANILNGKVHYIGVGVSSSGNTVYVTQEFMAS